jgi:hypothetical protein
MKNEVRMLLAALCATLLLGCVSQPQDAATTTLAETSTTAEETTTAATTTTTLLPREEVNAQVGCVPVSLSFSNNTLTIQADSEVLPASKSKSVDVYKIPADTIDNIRVNRNGLFVYYGKSCCETGEYETYHYFILASSGAKEKYMPESFDGLLYDYARIEGGYEAWSYREAASRDLTGSVKTWSECGYGYVLSMGWETRKVGKIFKGAEMIDRLS